MNLVEINEMIRIATKFAEIMKWDLDIVRIIPTETEIGFYAEGIVPSSIHIIKKNNAKYKTLSVSLIWKTDEIGTHGLHEWEEETLFLYRKRLDDESQAKKPSKDHLFNSSMNKNIITNYDEIVEMYEFIEDLNDVYHIKVKLVQERE